MNLIDNIKEEHKNRTQWLDENLTIRERARVDRQVAIRIVEAFIVYFLISGIIYYCLR